jgi:amino acid adenylation domain-containing protein
MSTPVRGDTVATEDHFGLPEPAEPLRALGRRQYSFWILNELVPDSAAANLSIAFRTSRTLRWWPLHVAVNHLAGRHPALRTRFPAAAGVPLRHVSAASDIELGVEVAALTEADLIARVQQAAAVPFDLGSDLPMRLRLWHVDGGGSVVLLTMHHIVSDAMSFALLMDELTRIYDAIAGGSEIPDELRGEAPATAELPAKPEDSVFWSEHLRDADMARAVLPWARPSPARPTLAGATLISPLAPETVSAVAALRRKLGTTENLILLTGYFLTLFRHGAGPDLVLGVPVVTGRAAGAPAAVGFGVSTLPLRMILDPKASFASVARRVQDVFLDGTQHSSISVEELLADIGHQSPQWWMPLFRYMYNYRPWKIVDVRIAGEQPEFLEIPGEGTQLDIHLTVNAGRRPPVLYTVYSTEVHDEADVASMIARMQVLLRAAADDPDRPVAELGMATDAERTALAAANDTRRTDRPGGTVLRQFLDRAEADPARTAIIDGDITLSYGELASAALRIAAQLRAVGVGDGDIVALALPRGVAMATAILAIWAAGACYLPLGTGQPRQRLASQLGDARPRLVVAMAGAAESEGLVSGDPVLAWPDLVARAEAAPAAAPLVPGLDAAAYVIYTSGSTGSPRGVVVSHRNLANLVSDFAERLGVTADDPVLWSTTTTFDISGLELFLPLSTGGPAVVAGSESQTRPRELLELVAKHDVSVVQGTPTFWRLAVAAMAGDELRGRIVLCGGEPMSAALARAMAGTGCRLFNVYGPTETTIWSTIAEIAAEVADPVPIGVPIANTGVFILDEHGAELPPGLLGELCIAGTGVSSGYLNRPELTGQRFASSPKWGRYYRTGDLARWRADGVLELFGRNDRQVKLRGHRIELPEVEAVLLGHADVADAALVVVGDPQSDAELRAFVQPATAAAPGLPERLWPYLAERLPSYSLPSKLAVLAEFPVSPNGKTDYPALRALDVTASTAASEGSAEDEADADPDLTRQLLALWRDTLRCPALGERDHFFLNGGHSLLAAQLADRITESAGRDISLRMVFDYPTPRQLSAHLVKER